MFKFVIFLTAVAFVRAQYNNQKAATSYSSITRHQAASYHTAPAYQPASAAHAYQPAPAAPLHQASRYQAAPAPAYQAVQAYAAPVIKAQAYKPVEHYAPAKYSFKYGVNDYHTGDIKSQQEERDGDVVHGEYSLLQPDGVTRTVKYTVDKHSGFNAQVIYSGHAVHPEQKIAKVAPVYKSY